MQSGNINLVQIDERNAVSLADLCIATFRDAYASTHSEADMAVYCSENYSAAKVARTLTARGTLCKIAYRDGNEVGFYLLREKACPFEDDDKAIELKQIYVRAREFGLGTGNILLEDAFAQAAQRQRTLLWLSVSNRNQRAQAFYKKTGFKPLGAGPEFTVGNDRLTSTVLARAV